MRHPPHLWPLLAGRALLAFAFGVLALAWPGITLYALVVLFGAWALVDGVSRLVTTIRAGADNDRRWPEILGGLAGIAVGVLTLVWPAVTALALTVLIAVWAIMIGVAETVAAIRWRRVLTGE
ncbi:MAG: HdeD family acid-resistance protein, partial [Frankiales bacterium]|nr:HdeD family acid-resistance protein [Frankiales bacterium]